MTEAPVITWFLDQGRLRMARDMVSMTRTDVALVGEEIKRLQALTGRIDSLFEAIAHGDDEHRAWLAQAIQDHFQGKKVKRP